MRRLRVFRPACRGLEERLVLSGSVAAAASDGLTSNVEALSSFSGEVERGHAPTLTVDFGTPSDSAPAGTVVMPSAAYSSSAGYGWLSDPGKIQVKGDVVTGRSGDFELDVPPGTYDITVTPAASAHLSAGSQVTAFATGNTLGGPEAFFADPGPPHPVTLRTTVSQSGAGNGLVIALNGGFAVRSVQITPVQTAEAGGIFTPVQPAPASGTSVLVSRTGAHLSISGAAQASVVLPESGTTTFDSQNGAPQHQSTNSPTNWALDFTKTAQGTIPGASSNPSVTGIISTISNVSLRNTGGTLDIHTPQGRVDLVVHGPAHTALPFSDLTSSIALSYTIHGGTGTFGGAKGSGTVQVSMTPIDQSVEGTVTTGALDPSVALGTLNFTFHPGS
jgi:hypothetical protein